MGISREYEGPKENIFLNYNNEAEKKLHIDEPIEKTGDNKNPDDDTIVLNA
jgi:hypothetical protein